MGFQNIFASFLLLSCACTISINSVAQNSEMVSYYKDSSFLRETKQKKAEFKKTVSIAEDGRKTIIGTKLLDNMVVSEKHFLEGVPVGIWKVLNSKKTELRIINFDKAIYSKDSIASGVSIDLDGADTLDLELPYYVSSDSKLELYRYLGETVRYPTLAKELGIQGTIFVLCSIDESGDISPEFIRRGVHPCLDMEAWRVITLMPDWISAKKDGEPIACNFLLPISFRLQ